MTFLERLSRIALTVVLISALLMTVPVDSYGATAKLTKPTIKSLTSEISGSFTVSTKKYSKVTGYQIKYSKNKEFTSYKVVKCKGAALNRKISGLEEGRTYYVKVRSYNSKGHSKWSKWKSVKTRINLHSETAYTTDIKTRLYKTANTSSEYLTVWYNSKIQLINSLPKSSGSYIKVKYNGSYYYIWLKKGSTKYKKKVSLIKTADTYKSYCSTDLQKEIIEKAFDICQNWNTRYYSVDQEGTGGGHGEESNGKYAFHCSGFAAFVVNEVMSQHADYVPFFNLSTDLSKASNKGSYDAYDIGTDKNGKAIKTTLVCQGKNNLNFDKLQVGDLLFFHVMDGEKNPDHVAIYIGNRQLIQSTRAVKGIYHNGELDSDGGVCIAPVDGMYKDGFEAAIRVLPDLDSLQDPTDPGNDGGTDGGDE